MNIAEYIKNQLPLWPNWINAILLRCNVFGGLVYGKSYHHYCKTIDKIDPTKKLLDMVNYAIKNVPYYREKYGDLEIHSIEDFETKIGFIDKDEVMSHWDKFIADNIDLNKCTVGTTGGTSGKPLKLVNTISRYAVELAFMHKMWKSTGWNYNIRGVIRNHKLPSSKTYIVNPITKELIFDAFRINAEYVQKIVLILKRYNVHYIQAYPSSAYHFCKICKKNNIDISFLKYFLCGSEGVSDEQYDFITNKMNIGLFSWYGHSEKLILGGTTSAYDHLCYIEPKYGLFELVDSNNRQIYEKGKQGEMVGTTFFNYVMPLIRYKTGDCAILNRGRENICENAVLSKIEGRWNINLIYKRDGTTTSITALNFHNTIYEKIDGMQYFQKEKGIIDVHLIKGDDYNVKIENEIYNHIKYAMGEDSVVNITYVDKLTNLPNGKFLPLISTIKK